MVKFNVFHWHITDSQSWPLDLAAYPELADKGAYSISRKYTEDNIRDVVEYAGHVRPRLLLPWMAHAAKTVV